MLDFGENAKALKEEQLAWLKQRNTKCKVYNETGNEVNIEEFGKCVESFTNARLKELGARVKKIEKVKVRLQNASGLIPIYEEPKADSRVRVSIEESLDYEAFLADKRSYGIKGKDKISKEGKKGRFIKIVYKNLNKKENLNKSSVVGFVRASDARW